MPNEVAVTTADDGSDESPCCCYAFPIELMILDDLEKHRPGPDQLQLEVGDSAKEGLNTTVEVSTTFDENELEESMDEVAEEYSPWTIRDEVHRDEKRDDMLETSIHGVEADIVEETAKSVSKFFNWFSSSGESNKPSQGTLHVEDRLLEKKNSILFEEAKEERRMKASVEHYEETKCNSSSAKREVVGKILEHESSDVALTNSTSTDYTPISPRATVVSVLKLETFRKSKNSVEQTQISPRTKEGMALQLKTTKKSTYSFDEAPISPRAYEVTALKLEAAETSTNGALICGSNVPSESLSKQYVTNPIALVESPIKASPPISVKGKKRQESPLTSIFQTKSETCLRTPANKAAASKDRGVVKLLPKDSSWSARSPTSRRKSSEGLKQVLKECIQENFCIESVGETFQRELVAAFQQACTDLAQRRGQQQESANLWLLGLFFVALIAVLRAAGNVEPVVANSDLEFRLMVIAYESGV